MTRFSEVVAPKERAATDATEESPDSQLDVPRDACTYEEWARNHREDGECRVIQHSCMLVQRRGTSRKRLAACHEPNIVKMIQRIAVAAK